MANPFGKTRDVENPYATYVGYHHEIGSIEVRILKRYKQSVVARAVSQSEACINNLGAAAPIPSQQKEIE